MNRNSEAGFSYIDVMVAIVILMVGILALLSAITGAVVFSNAQQEQLNAKQIVASTMEAIISTKETNSARLGWARVGNVGTNPDVNGVNQGIFVTGVQTILSDAGDDQIIGTADDGGEAIDSFTRQITITDECDPDRPSPNCPTPGNFAVRVRSVQIRVFYNVGRIQRSENLTTILTDYSVAN